MLPQNEVSQSKFPLCRRNVWRLVNKQVKEAVRFDSSVTGVSITKSLIACSRKAHAEYVQQLEKEKTKKRRNVSSNVRRH